VQLTEGFTVPVPSDRLWELLTDVERIAPCVPGFTLEEADHPDYRGRMKVKVGAINVTYDATITFVERDDESKRVVLTVKGKEVRGAGSVDATVTSSLIDRGDETEAEMVTDVYVTGRVAQFGRGIIADVSSRMTEQFVDRLNAQLLAPAADASANSAAGTGDGVGPAADAAAAGRSTAAGPSPSSADDEALDLGSIAAVPVLKRVAPLLALAGVLALLLRVVSRRSR
jgi:uncharacterized protein